ASQKELVWIGRLSTVILMVIACVLALVLESALQIFHIIVLIGAGTGLVFLLGWFWWRVHAAAALTAMIVSSAVAMLLQAGPWDLPEWLNLVVGVSITTASWGLVAFVTRPTSDDVLFQFYQR